MQPLNLVPTAGKRETVSSVGKYNCFIIQSSSCFWIPRRSDRKKEKSVVSFTHGQNIICSQAQLDDIAHEQTITCRQLFAGHVVGFRPMKRKKNLHRIIMTVTERVDFYKQVNSMTLSPENSLSVSKAYASQLFNAFEYFSGLLF